MAPLLSHPTRVRGLKPSLLVDIVATVEVAPHTGAWIETSIVPVCGYYPCVAPHTGAWIETSF